MEKVEGVAETGERPEQTLSHEDQHAIRAHLQAAVNDETAAENQNGDESGYDYHSD